MLVIEREGRSNPTLLSGLAEHFELIVAQTMARGLMLLRQQEFAGVFVDTRQLAAVRWAGLLIQADEILEAIADGLAVVEPNDLCILVANHEFQVLSGSEVRVIGKQFFHALGNPEHVGGEPSPFETAQKTRAAASAQMRLIGNRYVRVTVTPVYDPTGQACQFIALAHDMTNEELQKQKLDAIHKAGEELADLTPEELSEMGVEERIDLLKYNIVRHMKDLLGLDFIEIRLLERATGRLVPLVSEGMTNLAATRELFARREGNGVTGFVAATGKSYLCREATTDPLYLEGASGALSSLTVPLLFHGTLIGTLNVENLRSNAFDDRDRQLLEIYGRNVAAALQMLELLQAEKQVAANASIEAISRELALPVDDILNDATAVLDTYAGHDEDLVARLKHLLLRAREIRSLVHKAGSSIAPEPRRSSPKPPLPFSGARLLVVDADEAIRKAAHDVLGQQGAVVETASDGREALALARQGVYTAALTDIRLPDLNGYEVFHKLREVQPRMPVILMTAFGYDSTHSIVKARQEGLQTVLYKPFRTDRLMEAVTQAIRQGSQDPPALDGHRA
jgi:CheY-like chemotaxis protein